MEKKKKNKKVVFLLIGLGVVGIAGTAYYLYNRNRQSSGSLNDFLATDATNQSGNKAITLPDTSSSTKSDNSPKSNRTAKVAGNFPIKRGSKGKLVKLIQLALIRKYGKDLLPKWGADGSWGKETTDALIANGLPTEIDKNTFAKFIGHGVAESLSISGLQGNEQLKAIRDTRVWNLEGQKLPIPKNTIIGEFIDAENGVTTFETIDNQTLFILTKDISYV